MNPPNRTVYPSRALWRQLRALRGRALAVALILGAAVGVFAGVYSAIEGLFEFRAQLYRDANVAGYELRFVPEDAVNLPALDDAAPAVRREARLLLPGSVEHIGADAASGAPPQGRISALLVATESNTQQINRPLLLQGQTLQAGDLQGALIDHNFARHRGLNVGDTFQVRVGKDRMQLTVRGIAIFVEHLVDGAAPGFFMPSKGSLAVFQVDQRLIAERMGFSLVNSLVFSDGRAGSDLAPETVARIEQRARRTLNIEESLPLSKQFGHLYLTMDLGAFRIFTPAICLILAGAAALVFALVLRTWVAQQRAALGVLLGLGYRRRALIAAWAPPLAALWLAGVLIGVGIAWLMMGGFGGEFARAIGMPPPPLRLNGSALGVAVLGALLLVLAAAVWAFAELRRIAPIDAVRERSTDTRPAHTEVNLADPLWRYPLRTLLRYRWRTAGAVLLTACALAPALAFFVALDSFRQTIVDGLQRDQWHYTVDFLSPVWDDELPTFQRSANASTLEGFARGLVRVSTDRGVESVLITGVSTVTSMRRPTLLAGRWLSVDDRNAVLLERRVVEKLGLRVGEPLRLEGEQQTFQPTLIGVVSGVMPSEAYAPIEATRRWLALDAQNTGALIGMGQSSFDRLLDHELVARVMDKQRVTQEFVKHLDEIAGIIHLAMLFALLVAALSLLTYAALALGARRGDFALLRILGFSAPDVGRMMRREVALAGAAGVLLAIPLALLLALLLNGLLGRAWLHVNYSLRWQDVLIVSAAGLALLPLAAWPAVRAVRRLNPVHVLRERRLG